MEASVQIRSELTGIHDVASLEKAFAAAKEDSSIWKISFDAASGERVRLIKVPGEDAAWIYEDVFGNRKV